MSAELLLAPSAPAPALQWLSIRAASALCGKSERHLQRLCGETWLSEDKARTVRQKGRKPVWEVRSDADPAFTAPQPASVPAPVLDADTFKQFPARARSIAMARRVLLGAWEQYLSAVAVAMQLPRDAGTDRFLQTQAAQREKDRAEGRPDPLIDLPSRSTLYVWAQRHKEEGIVGLVPGWSRRVKETALAKEADPFLDAVKRYWLNQRRRSIKTCHEMAMGEADRLGWPYRSYAMAKRMIEQIPPEIVSLLRKGEKDFEDNHAPFINGDYAPLQSNEIWDADHHQFDVLVQVGTRTNTATGEEVPYYARPILTAWQDMRSRKIVGWIIRLADPNTDAIIEALDLAMASHDCPHAVYTDNGKDFDAWALTGVTKQMRWARRRLKVFHDQTALGGIYAAFGIRHIHAWPYHGQSKPIERFFGRMEDQFGRMWSTYCGRNPQEKPEDLPQQLARGNAPTLEEFTAAFGDWLEVSYHATAHRGDAMEEKSPAEVWEANLQVRRVCPPELRRLLLQKRIGRMEKGEQRPLKVGQNGVCHQGIWYGQYELASHFGREVFLRIDRADVGQVFVYAAQGDTFLAVAPANLKVPRNASQQDLREAIAEKARRTQAMKEGARARIKMHEDLVDIMLRAAQRRKALAAPVETNPIPPSISPVRSPLEAQLSAVQRASEVPLKKAVGDGVSDGRFQYHATSPEDEGAGDGPSGFTYHGGFNSGDSDV